MTGATHFLGGKDPNLVKNVCQIEVESAEEVRCTCLAKRSHIKGATRALQVTQKKSVFDYQTNDYVHPKDANYPTKTARQTLRRFWQTSFAHLRKVGHTKRLQGKQP
jgi:hypothetical protein